MGGIDTKKAERRPLKFESLEALSADLDRLEEAHRAGTLRHTGNWSAGQIFEHCSKLMRAAIDGFPDDRPALMLRWMGRTVIRRMALKGGAAPAGYKTPEGASYLSPGDEVSFDQGIGALRSQVARIEAGERFTHASPLFGSLTHEEWTIVQLGHCSLHLSFLHPS
jgi:hypothetical protein